jgi:hypothetical protein
MTKFAGVMTKSRVRLFGRFGRQVSVQVGPFVVRTNISIGNTIRQRVRTALIGGRERMSSAGASRQSGR